MALQPAITNPPAHVSPAGASSEAPRVFKWQATLPFCEFSIPRETNLNPALPQRPVTLYRLTQMHSAPWPMEGTAAWSGKIFESQWRIAQFLQAHPHSLVIDEGLSFNLSFSSIVQASVGTGKIVSKYGGKLPDLSALEPAERLYLVYGEGSHGAAALAALSTFPHGIPDRPELFNAHQKKFITDFGAARTLGYLGVLHQVHSSCTPQELKERVETAAECVKKWGPGFLSSQAQNPLVMSEFTHKPEAQLKRQVERLLPLAQRHKLPLVVVFGSKHKLAQNFSDTNLYNFAVPAGFPAEGTVPAGPPWFTFSMRDWTLLAAASTIAALTGFRARIAVRFASIRRRKKQV